MPRPARKFSGALFQPHSQYAFWLVLACTVPVANVFISTQWTLSLLSGPNRPHLSTFLYVFGDNRPIYSLWIVTFSDSFFFFWHSPSESVPFGYYPSLVWRSWWRLDHTEWSRNPLALLIAISPLATGPKIMSTLRGLSDIKFQDSKDSQT